MPDLIKCANAAVQKGYITKAAADDIKSFYQNELKAGKADNAETAMAAVKKMQYDKIRTKKLALMNAKRKTDLVNLIKSHKGGLHEGLKSLITKNITDGAGYSNIEYRAKAIDDLARMELTDAFDALREQWGTAWWTRDKSLNDAVIKEIFGVDSGNSAAKKFAKQWNETAEAQRLQFNAAGGDIPKLSNWNMPQSHNQFKVGKAGVDTWKADIRGKLDTKAMGLENDPEGLEKLLDYVYESISTGGLNKLEPGKIPKGVSSSLAKRGQQHRVLHFNSPEDYIDYSTKYGNDDLYTVMSDHLRGSSHDIAAMDIMGSNPQHMFDFLQDHVKKNDPNYNKSWETAGFMQSMFDVSTGKVDSLYNGTAANVTAAKFFGGFRSLNVAGKLGSALVSSVTDLGAVIMTSRYNDIPVMKTLYNGFKTMVQQDRIKVGAKIGHGMEAWNGTTASRFSEAGDVNSWLDKAADKTLRASGLSLWTEGFRKSFSMEFSATIADNFKVKHADLSKNFKKNLERYGIGKDQWDKIRKSQPVTADGVSYLDPKAVLNLKGIDKAEARELTFSVMEMIKSETDMAVIQPDARVRAWTTAGAEKGTITGELSRTASQFKSFPMAVMLTHLKRGLGQETLGGKFGYLAPYMMMSVGMGAMAVQAKEAIKGREPIPMDSGKFWGAAAIQGGGLGLFGDFLFSDQSRFGSSFTESMIGPLGSLINDAYNVTVAPIHEAADPDKDVGLTRLAHTAKGYIPGNNLWYSRLLFGKMFDEAVTKNIDPKFGSKVRARERKRKKEWGNESWYK